MEESHENSEGNARDRYNKLLELLAKVKGPESEPSLRDPKAEEEADYYDKEKKRHDHERREIALRDYQNYVKNRQKYVDRIYMLMIGWMFIVLLVVVAAGMSRPSQPGFLNWIISFDLPHNVLLALVGSTTGNVIGIFLIVARHLYPR